MLGDRSAEAHSVAQMDVLSVGVNRQALVSRDLVMQSHASHVPRV